VQKGNPIKGKTQQTTNSYSHQKCVLHGCTYDVIIAISMMLFLDKIYKPKGVYGLVFKNYSNINNTVHWQIYRTTGYTFAKGLHCGTAANTLHALFLR